LPAFEIFQYPYMNDNYGVLVYSSETGETAAIDAGDGDALLGALDKKGWKLTHLLITHHHGDHTAGLMAVKGATNCQVYGPAASRGKVDGVDRFFGDGDQFGFGGETVSVIATPGHTLDMINFYFAGQKTVFTGDTLFTLGCGRVFEGTPQMMWESLSKLAKLPPETIVYSSHEYTLANAKFAVSIDPENKALIRRKAEMEKLRAEGLATVPSTIGAELETNPFLRAGNLEIRKRLGMEAASDSEVFAEIRKRKDNF